MVSDFPTLYHIYISHLLLSLSFMLLTPGVRQFLPSDPYGRSEVVLDRKGHVQPHTSTHVSLPLFYNSKTLKKKS